MSQLTIFTGKRQTGQTTRLVEAIVEKAKTHIVLCFAHDATMAKELFAKLQLKVGVSLDTSIPNINVMNVGHDSLIDNIESIALRYPHMPVTVAIDDVPLAHLAWLTEWVANTGNEVLAAYSSDVDFKIRAQTAEVKLSTDQLLRQLNASTTSSYHALMEKLVSIAVHQSFVVVNVENCALTLNITDPQKSDCVFAANSKLTPGVKFKVTKLTNTAWMLGIADKQ